MNANKKVHFSQVSSLHLIFEKRSRRSKRRHGTRKYKNGSRKDNGENQLDRLWYTQSEYKKFKKQFLGNVIRIQQTILDDDENVDASFAGGVGLIHIDFYEEKVSKEFAKFPNDSGTKHTSPTKNSIYTGKESYIRRDSDLTCDGRYNNASNILHHGNKDTIIATGIREAAATDADEISILCYKFDEMSQISDISSESEESSGDCDTLGMEKYVTPQVTHQYRHHRKQLFFKLMEAQERFRLKNFLSKQSQICYDERNGYNMDVDESDRADITLGSCNRRAHGFRRSSSSSSQEIPEHMANASCEQLTQILLAKISRRGSSWAREQARSSAKMLEIDLEQEKEEFRHKLLEKQHGKQNKLMQEKPQQQIQDDHDQQCEEKRQDQYEELMAKEAVDGVHDARSLATKCLNEELHLVEERDSHKWSRSSWAMMSMGDIDKPFKP